MSPYCLPVVPLWTVPDVYEEEYEAAAVADVQLADVVAAVPILGSLDGLDAAASLPVGLSVAAVYIWSVAPPSGIVASAVAVAAAVVAVIAIVPPAGLPAPSAAVVVVVEADARYGDFLAGPPDLPGYDVVAAAAAVLSPRRYRRRSCLNKVSWGSSQLLVLAACGSLS